MKRRRFVVVAVALLTLAGCTNSPTGLDGFATEELIVELAVLPNHFHIWETMGVFTASVVDPDENPVTNFEEIRVERQLDGAGSWGAIPLTHAGSGIYVGEYIFESPGSYGLRVAGIRPSDNEMKVMLELDEPLEVVRAHSHAGGYDISFEAVPGHIHQGDQSTMNFTFTEAAEAAPAGPAQVITTPPTILIGPDGSEGAYSATETTPGTFTATHTFTEVGTVPVTVRFVGEDTEESEYSVNVIVHEAH